MTRPQTFGARVYVVTGQSFSREQVIHRYLHLVKYVATRIAAGLPPNVDVADLINDGVLGLIDAIEKYDDGRGVKFETYAITRIHGAIVDALRSLDWVPRAIRQRARELERVQHELEAELGRTASDAELASRLGITRTELDALLVRVRGTALVSLEERLSSERGQDIPLRDMLGGPDDDIGSSVEGRELREQLTDAIFALPRSERIVVIQYYFEGRTLKQIKDELGVSESRVSQIHAQAVVRLRRLLRELQSDLGYREADARARRKYVRRRSAAEIEAAG